MIKLFELKDLSMREDLFSLISKDYEPSDTMAFNLFKEPCRFTDWVLECAKQYDGNEYIVHRGWCVTQNKGEVSPANYIHSHQKFPLVAVFYLNAVEGHPDLYVCDQTDNNNFLSKQTVIPDGETAMFKFKLTRVKPETNKLVIFPGYYLHGVSLNTLDVPRISIPLNLSRR